LVGKFKQDSLEDQDTDGDIEVYLKETGGEWVGWIHLPQYRKEWWATANTEMNFRVP
jgi:hypothetical protein